MEERVADLERMVERHEIQLMMLVVALRTAPELADAMAAQLEKVLARMPYGSPLDKYDNKSAVVELIARLRGASFGG